jgi:hypothetical protein
MLKTNDFPKAVLFIEVRNAGGGLLQSGLVQRFLRGMSSG